MFAASDHTFCLCAYGESEYLESCMQSLLSQNVQTNIVVATATPNSHIEQLCKKYNLELHVRDGQPGIAPDWNFALSCAKTPLATLAHQDDFYLLDYSEQALEYINSEPDTLLYFTNYAELHNGETIANNALLRTKRILISPLKIKGFRHSKFVRRRILSFGTSICCPSVTMNLPRLQDPVFIDRMRADLDWEAWANASKLDGAFVYNPKICMLHRIHEGSETSACLHDDTRAQEDLYMFKQFWPSPIAHLLNTLYASSRNMQK